MVIIICILISGCIGYIIGSNFASTVKPPKVDIEEPMSTNDEESYTLTEDDKNKVIAYALKQLKYNQTELQISTYSNDMGRCSQHNWRYYAFLDDLSIVFYIEDIVRWKSDTELTLLNQCVDKFIEGENPFAKVSVELRTDDDRIEITDWETIEKFIDILFDTYLKMTFHKFVSYRVAEKKRLAAFRKERKAEIYKKIGIGE